MTEGPRVTMQSCIAKAESVRLPLCELPALFGQPQFFWKRGMDVVVALLALLLLSPLFLLIALFIKIVSPGPVFFRQTRVGRLGRRFDIWKFRTMNVDADSSAHENHLEALISRDQPMEKLDAQDDPRIIPCGKLIRQTGVDELPQLFNVLRGEMSLVGPRPCIPYEAEKFLLWQRARFDALPGITGLWQVSGKNRTTFQEMIRLDIRYARNVSFWLDVKILCKTVPAILEQLYEDEKGAVEGNRHGKNA
jgi:lipopolysaccharide/colanic/teichoic acid biosynthesis glycosyltransferase